MRLLTLVMLVLGTVAAPSPSSAQLPPANVNELSWLAGCWKQDGTDRTIEEHWLPPAGGTMLGMGRTVARGKTVAYEYTRIEEKDGVLVFTATPSGQPTASFTQIASDTTSVVFENAAHDFPQRVIYRRQPDGSLFGRIEGQQNGKERAVDFPMKRADCLPPPHVRD